MARGLFPAADERFASFRVTGVRAPTPAEGAELELQLLSAGTKQSSLGSGGAVPARRLRRKTGAAEDFRMAADAVKRAYGLTGGLDLEGLTARWKRLRRVAVAVETTEASDSEGIADG